VRQLTQHQFETMHELANNPEAEYVLVFRDGRVNTREEEIKQLVAMGLLMDVTDSKPKESVTPGDGVSVKVFQETEQGRAMFHECSEHRTRII
jgi:hypothetical protein